MRKSDTLRLEMRVSGWTLSRLKNLDTHAAPAMLL